VIVQRGYRSLPLSGRSRIAYQVVQQFGPDLCAKVPGFVQRQGERGPYWTLSGQPGVLVPIRHLDGAIVGLVVRCDEPGEGGKYRWLSSKAAGGPGPLVSVHVPMFAGAHLEVRLTEGQLKADVATALSGVLTLGVPGVGSWRLALPVLERLKPDSVLLAWDADWRHNPHVARSLGDCARYLKKARFDVQMEDWCPDQGKGIDDLLLHGHSPTRKGWAACLASMYRGRAVRATAQPRFGA
jgi:hypothetical protein